MATSVPVPIAMPTSAAAKRRRIVDAVAGHRDDAAFGLQPLHHRGLVLREGPRPRPRRCRARCATARRSSCSSPVSMTMRTPASRKALRACGVVGLMGSAIADEAGQLAVQADEDHRGRPGALRSAAAMRRLVDVDAALGEEFGGAARPPVPVDHADHAFADGRVEVGHRRERQLALLRVRHDGRGQRVLAGPLDAGKLLQHVVRVEAGGRLDVDHLRPAFGERAGLVDDQRVDLLHPLERLGVPDQHAVLRAAADADHDGHRRGQAERTRAGDDQHRHRRRRAHRRTPAPGPRPARRRRSSAATR